jgi:hypothetical protein
MIGAFLEFNALPLVAAAALFGLPARSGAPVAGVLSRGGAGGAGHGRQVRRLLQLLAGAHCGHLRPDRSTGYPVTEPSGVRAAYTSNGQQAGYWCYRPT